MKYCASEIFREAAMFLVSISNEAQDFIRQKEKPVYLEMHKEILNCCMQFQECPVVRWGIPRDLQNYEKMDIGDSSVFIPHRLPEDMPFTIILSSFLGFKRLVLDGWNY
jgi:hypothetical protein